MTPLPLHALRPTRPPGRYRTLIRPTLLWFTLAALAFAASVIGCFGCSAAPKNWVAYYGADAPPEELQGFGLIVVDPGYRGSIKALKARGSKVLAYLSLGEIATHHSAFSAAKRAGLLLRENPNWRGAWVVDVRNPGWQRMVLEQLTPALLRRGFDGLFLDTIDSPLHLGHTEAKRFPGMKAAAIGLIRALHARHPKAQLMLNGGLPIIGSLRRSVHLLAIESTLSTWDFSKKEAKWRAPKARAAALTRLRAARQDNPGLQIFTLDYWRPEDRAGVRKIYRQQRKQGFIPYVATIALTRVVAEPEASSSAAQVNRATTAGGRR